MSGLDYSTFSLCSALTPSQPASTSARSYPADPNEQHVAGDVIDSHICDTQRDDLPLSPEMTDYPREEALAQLGPYQGQGPSDRTSAFPGSPFLSDPADDIQGSILCARLGGFHFTSPYSGAVGHGHGSDDLVNAPTGIMENVSWSSPHSLHYPTPFHGSVSPSAKSTCPITEDARPELSLIHCDVSSRISPVRRTSMMAVATDHPLGKNYEFGLAGASSSPLTAMSMDMSPFLSGGVITSPSPPSTIYQDDDFSSSSGGECSAHAFSAYSEQQQPGQGMIHTTAHAPAASHYPLDRQTAVAPSSSSSFGGFQEGPEAAQHHSGLDHHRYAPLGMPTPLPGYSSSQSPHDHPICCDEPACFGAAMHAAGRGEEGEEELPRPGSAPPLMDNEVPFVGDARALLQSPLENVALSCEHIAGSGRPHTTWYHYPPLLSSPHPSQVVVAPAAQGAGVGISQSPRSSPRRAGSIGHNSQKTPPSSRHLRRWSSVTNPALRGSPPFPSSFSTNVVPFPRYHLAGVVPPTPSAPVPAPSDSTFSQFSPEGESDGDDAPTAFGVPLPHGTVDVADTIVVPADQPQFQVSSQSQAQATAPVSRGVVRCEGYLIDEESWSVALSRPDKALHVYECLWDVQNTPCGMWIEGDQSSVADHLALFHGFRGGEVTTRCLWHACPKPHMKGTSIARHVVTHIGFRVKCHTCKHEFARVDACNRAHSRSGCLGVGQPMYGDLQRVLDARKVDPLQRPCKKRRTDE